MKLWALNEDLQQQKRGGTRKGGGGGGVWMQRDISH